MKNKFERLSKEEKIKAIEDYRNESPKNANYLKNLRNLKIISIFGIIYGIIMLLVDLFWFHKMYYVYIIDSVVLIFSVYMLLQANRIKSDVINNYLITNMNKVTNKPKKRNHKSKKKNESVTEVKEEVKKEEVIKENSKNKTTKKGKNRKKNTKKKAKSNEKN